MCRVRYNYITFGGVSFSPNVFEAVRDQAAPAPAQAAAA
eukprot:SAG11_NODE_43421_length_166_cov_14.940299_1_plen_38_part_01